MLLRVIKIYISHVDIYSVDTTAIGIDSKPILIYDVEHNLRFKLVGTISLYYGV